MTKVQQSTDCGLRIVLATATGIKSGQSKPTISKIHSATKHRFLSPGLQCRVRLMLWPPLEHKQNPLMIITRFSQSWAPKKVSQSKLKVLQNFERIVSVYTAPSMASLVPDIHHQDALCDQAHDIICCHGSFTYDALFIRTFTAWLPLITILTLSWNDMIYCSSISPEIQTGSWSEPKIVATFLTDVHWFHNQNISCGEDFSWSTLLNGSSTGLVHYDRAKTPWYYRWGRLPYTLALQVRQIVLHLGTTGEADCLTPWHYRWGRLSYTLALQVRQTALHFGTTGEADCLTPWHYRWGRLSYTLVVQVRQTAFPGEESEKGNETQQQCSFQSQRELCALEFCLPISCQSTALHRKPRLY